jgi:hypothetical protein
MNHFLYYTENSFCYLKITKVLNITDDYMEAEIDWFTRPGKTFLFKTVEKLSAETVSKWQRFKL